MTKLALVQRFCHPKGFQAIHVDMKWSLPKRSLQMVYELKRFKNIERNKKELKRLGLVTTSGKKTDDKVDAEETDREFAGSSGALPAKCIGKHNYQLAFSVLQKLLRQVKGYA